MRRTSVVVSLLAVVLLGLAVGLGLAGGAIAQEGTPPAEEEFELPEGVSFEALGFGTVEELPVPPAELGLFRFGLEPGVRFPLDPGPEVTLAYVEAGVLTVTMEGPMTVLRAAGPGTPFPMQAETFAAGETFELAVGDSAIFPAGVAGEVRNEGNEAATVLTAEVLPAEGPAGTPGAATPAA